MKNKITRWVIASTIFTIVVFFSCAEGDIQASHKDVLPEDEIKEDIALQIFNTRVKADNPAQSIDEVEDPDEVEEIEEIQSKITCREINKEIVLDLETIDAPIIRNFYGAHSGIHKMNVAVGKDFDAWVAKGARVYVKDLKVTLSRDMSAAYVYLNQLSGAHFIWLFGISGTHIDEIGWDGEVDAIPLLIESTWNKPDEGEFWKAIKIRFSAYGRLPAEDVEIQTDLTILACGDFTELGHYVFWWEG